MRTTICFYGKRNGDTNTLFLTEIIIIWSCETALAEINWIFWHVNPFFNSREILNITPDKAFFSTKIVTCIFFLISLQKHKEALLMRTHNLCFQWEIRKIFTCYSLLSKAMFKENKLLPRVPQWKGLQNLLIRVISFGGLSIHLKSRRSH